MSRPAPIRSLRGFNDVLPAEARRFQQVFDAARASAHAYGYGEIRLPILESLALFKRGVGETTDIVEKEMFSFADREGETVALRPEGTAGCVRAGLEHGLLHNQHQRLWYAGPMFRHERPQAGRYRQFHQVGLEAYGMEGPDIDAEVIAVAARFLRTLGLKGLRLEINSLGGPDTREAYRAALVEYFGRYTDTLDEDSRRRLGTNPLRILDSKVPATQALVADAPRLEGFLDSDSRAHFDGFRQALTDLGIGYTVNPTLVRGLDYYTRGVFEWTTDRLGAQGTVLAGGRYDRLVERLGGQPCPAVGWATGVERLVLLLAQQAADDVGTQGSDTAATATADIYLVAGSDTAAGAARRAAETLRDAHPNLRTVLHAGGGKLPKILARAVKTGARFAVVVGPEGAAPDAAQVRYLVQDRAPDTVPLAELARHLPV